MSQKILSDLNVCSEADFVAAKFEPKELYAHQSYVTGVALAGKTLVTGGYDGKLKWFDTEAGMPIRTIEAHAKWIRKVIASPDGKLVASYCNGECVNVVVSNFGLEHALVGVKRRDKCDQGGALVAVVKRMVLDEGVKERGALRFEGLILFGFAVSRVRSGTGRAKQVAAVHSATRNDWVVSVSEHIHELLVES